jgi:hypothetical protein
MPNTQTPDFIPAANAASSAPDFIPHVATPDFIPATPPQGVPTGSISARPSGVTSWFEDLQGDIRYGTGATLPGRLLRALGAPGTSAGVPDAVGEFMGGPVIGPAKIATGLARSGRAVTSSDVAGQRGTQLVRGANEVVSGAMQTPGPFTGAVLGPAGLAQLPAYIAGGQVVQRGLEATGASPDASELGSNLITLLAGMGAAARNRASFRSSSTPAVESAPVATPAQAPESGEFVYRSRDVGETGVPNDSHSQATTSLDQAIGYLDSRARITGKPQELVRINLDDLDAEHYTRMPHPDGMDWIKFNRPLAESEVQRVNPQTGLAIPSPADLVRDAGLVYKGEFPGTGVHQFEDAAYPGKTAALRASDMTSASAIRERMNAKLVEFGIDPSTLRSVVDVSTPTNAPNAANTTTPVQQPSLIQRGFEKWATVRSHDPEIGDALQQLDNAPNYYRAKAQNAVKTILGEGESRLSPEQERLFTLLADSDSSENLYTKHPEEYAAAKNDPAIQSALERYKPYEQELTAARQKLGGGTLEGDYLARIYEEHTGERLPGTGQRRIGIQNENAPYSPERSASAEYFYQSGLHELEPSFAPKYVATNLRLLRDQLVQNFTRKATRLERGQELPDSITYNGHEYSKPDLSPGAKSKLTDYSVYDSQDGRYIGPKAVVDALRNYDPVAARSGPQLGPIRSWMQKQVLMGGAGVPHAFNILRRVASEAPLGVADPRGWINAARVTFGKELRARGLQGLNDPTFDALVKNGALSANEMTALKRYWGGNLNPANWAEGALRPGKKLLFEPGTLGGLGGLDQRARVWLADRIRADRPDLSDAAIAREVNTTLGSYSRTNWTEFQKKLGYFLLFPGWDTSSMHYTLTHPVKSAVPSAMLNLIANQTLSRLGKQRDPQDAYDPFSVHVGDHSVSTSLTREAMAIHLARPLWTAAIEAYHGRPALDAGGKQAIREGLHMLRPDLSGLVALGASAAGLNLPGATVYSRDDVLVPGKILPNRAMEKTAAFAILKANPMADRLLSGDTGHLEQTLRTYQDALSGNREALKTLGTWAAHSALSSVGVYDYRRDAEQRLMSTAKVSRLVTYNVARYYATGNPQKATAVMSDPQNAALAMFHNDFNSLSRGLRQLNDAYDRAKTDSDRKEIEAARKQLLANSELLIDTFTQAETNNWQRQDTARKAAQRAAQPDFIPAQ